MRTLESMSCWLSIQWVSFMAILSAATSNYRGEMSIAAEIAADTKAYITIH